MKGNHDFDVCVIGSGAGGSPVAFILARAGYSVVVLERGPWFTTDDFRKDELACCLRDTYRPSRRDEPHVIELEDDDGGWREQLTEDSRWNFWNGNCVGGASNFMSGYFHRLKPVDFRLLSEFGPIEGGQHGGLAHRVRRPGTLVRAGGAGSGRLRQGGASSPRRAAQHRRLSPASVE